MHLIPICLYVKIDCMYRLFDKYCDHVPFQQNCQQDEFDGHVQSLTELSVLNPL